MKTTENKPRVSVRPPDATQDVKASFAAPTGSVTLSLKEAKLIVLQVEILSSAFHFYMPSSVSNLKSKIESRK